MQSCQFLTELSGYALIYSEFVEKLVIVVPAWYTGLSEATR